MVLTDYCVVFSKARVHPPARRIHLGGWLFLYEQKVRFVNE